MAEENLHSTIVSLERVIHTREVELEVLRRSLKAMRSAGQEYTLAPRSDKYASMGLNDAAYELLSDGVPRNSREIAETLLDGGIRTLSHNYPNTVYNTLNQSATFVRNERKKWTLAAEPPKTEPKKKAKQAK